MTVRRGTSNTNDRGSSYERRRRKCYLLATFGDGISVTCYRCPRVLLYSTVESDRIIPGVLKGRYTRDNIRPCCGDCNRETGNAVRDLLAKGYAPEELIEWCLRGEL